MKIEVYEKHQKMVENFHNENKNVSPKTVKAEGVKLSVSAIFDKNKSNRLFGQTNYSAPGEDKKLSKEELMTEAEALYGNFKAMCNQMDLGEVVSLSENGVKVEDTEVKDIVTVAKQIRIKMAAAGNDRVYTGDIDDADIEAVMGNPALTAAVVNSFRENAYPVTGDNVNEAMLAYEEYDSLTVTDTAAKAYMMKNELSPTIDNLYAAEHAGNMLDMDAEIDDKLWEGIRPQIEESLENVGIEVNQDVLYDMRLFVGAEVPVNEDSLKIYSDALKADEIIEKDSFSIDRITYAMIEGDKAGDALVSDEKPAFIRAYEAVEVLNNTDISEHRLLAELQLKLTFEAAFVLEKNNISVSTTELSKLVEELRKLENDIEAGSIPYNIFDAEERNTLNIGEETKDYGLSEVMETLDYLKSAPAAALGRAASYEEISINSLSDTAKSMERAYRTAVGSYETMSTEFRPDLGDRIDKAIVASSQSVLEELKLQKTPENERAIRILVYNSLEVTYENVERVKAIDADMKEIFKRMTGRNAKALLDNNEDVLGMDVHSLAKVLESMPYDAKEDEKKSLKDFAEKVYENKSDKKLSDDEKELFTGLYTVMKKLLNDDGIAIGSIMKQGMDINLSNMVSAYLTRKDGQIDLNTDMGETAGHLSSRLMYYKNLIENAAKVSESATEMLSENEVPLTLNNMIAGQIISETPGYVYSGMKRMGISSALDGFLSRIESKKTLREGFKKLSEDTESFINSASENDIVDMDALRQIGNGMNILNSMANHNTFYIPYDSETSTTAIRLSVVENDEERGSFTVDMNSEERGHISITAKVTEDSVNASIVCDGELDVTGLKEALSELGIIDAKIGVSSGRLHPSFEAGKESFVDTKKIFSVAKVFIDYCR